MYMHTHTYMYMNRPPLSGALGLWAFGAPGDPGFGVSRPAGGPPRRPERRSEE